MVYALCSKILPDLPSCQRMVEEQQVCSFKEIRQEKLMEEEQTQVNIGDEKLNV